MKHYVIFTVFFFIALTSSGQKTFDPNASNDDTRSSDLAEANMIDIAIYRGLFNGEPMIFYERAVTPMLGLEIGAGPNWYSAWDYIWNAVTQEKGHPYYTDEIDVMQGIGFSFQGGAKYFTYGKNFIGTYIPLSICYRSLNFNYKNIDLPNGQFQDAKTNIKNFLITAGYGYVTAGHLEYSIQGGLRSINGEYYDSSYNLSTISKLRFTLMFDARYVFKF